MDFLGFKFESLKLNSDVYGEEKRQIEVRHFFFGFFYFYWKKIKEPDLKAELRPGTKDSGSASRRSLGPMRSRIHHTMKVRLGAAGREGGGSYIRSINFF